MLNKRAAERHVQELLAAADAEHRSVGLQKTIQHGKLEGRSSVLGRDGIVAMISAVQGGVDVEAAAGHHQPVQQPNIVGGQLHLMGQRDRQPARLADGRAIIFANRIPGQIGEAAGRFGIQSKADTRPAS